MLRDRMLRENAKIVATKIQTITNKWNSDKGYLIIRAYISTIESTWVLNERSLTNAMFF